MNPIRKRRALRVKLHTLDNSRFYWYTVRDAFWYVVCPDCSEALKVLDRRSSRKQAKDLLHHHRVTRHAAPGGDSS